MKTQNDFFEKITRNEFHFLEVDYNFQIQSVTKDNYGCFIMYKSPTLAIRISREIYDGGVFVYFYKLKDGTIPQYPTFFDPKAEFLIFDFDNLLILRTNKPTEQNQTRIYEDSEYVKSVVASYAQNLKLYASDILSGDFSIMPRIHEIVCQRAKGQALEVKVHAPRKNC